LDMPWKLNLPFTHHVRSGIEAEETLYVTVARMRLRHFQLWFEDCRSFWLGCLATRYGKLQMLRYCPILSFGLLVATTSAQWLSPYPSSTTRLFLEELRPESFHDRQCLSRISYLGLSPVVLVPRSVGMSLFCLPTSRSGFEVPRIPSLDFTVSCDPCAGRDGRDVH
jgi:hypothetical protein